MSRQIHHHFHGRIRLFKLVEFLANLDLAGRRHRFGTRLLKARLTGHSWTLNTFANLGFNGVCQLALRLYF